MTKKEKGKEIQAILNELFPYTPVPLHHKDPYTLLIAVLLSAQCTDERVNQITAILFPKAATPQEMILLSIEEIYEIIKPCGLGPAKSKAIFNLSKLLLEKYDGQVPNQIHLLEELPGVGHKTASVVMVQAFGVPAFPVDTHIHRLAYRWGLSTGKSVEKTEEDLKKIYDSKDWNKLHLQMIYYGRKFCPARAHKIDQCPVCNKYGRAEIKKGN